MNQQQISNLLLHHVCDKYQGKYSEYAKSLGVSPQFVSAVIRGKKTPNKQMLDDIGVEKITVYQYK